jgi:tRNA A37 threonylcarbamoyladenosine dehydratase
MSTLPWVQRLFDNQQLRPMLFGAVVTASAVFLVQFISKQYKIRKLKSEIIVDWDKEFSLDSVTRQVSFTDIDQEQESLMLEQLSRNIAFLGEQGTTCLRNSFVIVVGLGGVGSHAAHMLARAGVARMRLIDFDQVTLSSLNRHAVATRKDVGIPKVTAMKNHLLKIVPQMQIDARVNLFKIEDAEELLEGEPDFVLDCIDHLQTKAELIQYCVEKRYKVISSMGAGAKSDPSRIQIADINDTSEDPLAR